MTMWSSGLGAMLGLLATVIALPSAVSFAQPQRRLPAGHHWGRCLLVVRGQTRISGPCAYRIGRGGDFHIDGPRQIYDGIDYPTAEIMAQRRSTDYWAEVFREDDGIWTGYGNEDIRAVHAERPDDFGQLHRVGACLVGADVRVCLWRD